MFLAQHYGSKQKDKPRVEDDDDAWFGRCPDPLQDGLVSSLHVHYIRCAEECGDVREDWSDGGLCMREMRSLPPGYDVLDPIDRDSDVPPVLPIPGIRTDYFCFGPCSSTHVWVRRKSCHCESCLPAGRKVFTIGKECKNYDVCGPWIKVRVFPDDDVWKRIYEYLDAEGRNETGKWNDTCGVLMDDGTETMEFGCGEGGVLLKCTYCHAAFHYECCGLGDQRQKAPTGDWACPSCVSHARSQTITPFVVCDDKPNSLDDVISYCVTHNVDYGRASTYKGVMKKLRGAGHKW